MTPMAPMATPMAHSLIVADGVFPLYSIAPRFEQAAAELDGEICSFVLAKLRALYGPVRKPLRKKSAAKGSGI